LSQLPQAERLALAIRAEVARVRSEEASDRAASLDRRLVPLLAARQRFSQRHRRDPDLEREDDLSTLFTLIVQAGGPRLTREDIDLAAEATREAAARQGLAVLAMTELAKVLPASGVSILEWCDVSEEEFLSALLTALGLRDS
jgi:hypothetical protein